MKLQLKSLALFIFLTLFLVACDSKSRPSVSVEPRTHDNLARLWNEVILEGIRNDYARPTIHARNLFHTSIAMYDAWAAYSDEARPYILGQQHGDSSCEFDSSVLVGDVDIAREQAISFAVYRLIKQRFKYSPRAAATFELADKLMSDLGLDPVYTSKNYSNGSAIGLGNHIADCIVNFGFQDGSNERINYINTSYQHVNPDLIMASPGNTTLVDFNRWQPLALLEFIDQSGNVVAGGSSSFLSPEWGQVSPFALKPEDATLYEREGFQYRVYHDPGAPPLFGQDTEAYYKWGFSLVAKWSSHLSPEDGVMMDISPAALGNITNYPATFSEYAEFYKEEEGGDASLGYALNPITGREYVSQLVPRGDYARVLAEFWADGPRSETPPGHWFVIFNTVADHPLIERRYQGVGPEINELEWYVKSYFILGGAMHDSAIASWGIKGWYDYIRPVSAIRAMSSLGQSSDSSLPSYHQGGIPLTEGYIELVKEGDALAGAQGQNIGKVKVKAWRGPDFITTPEQDTAGVAWILADNWWPYQRPSFVTPPFAGYVSGHSTYSRAGAEVLTAITGDRFFPGGMSSFKVKANDFLVFENGPSVDMTLQWATYQDASDQCSLSRIWGGIHPPADDIPGRLIGEKIGLAAFEFGQVYFNGEESR